MGWAFHDESRDNGYGDGVIIESLVSIRYGTGTRAATQSIVNKVWVRCVPPELDEIKRGWTRDLWINPGKIGLTGMSTLRSLLATQLPPYISGVRNRKKVQRVDACPIPHKQKALKASLLYSFCPTPPADPKWSVDPPPPSLLPLSPDRL